MPVPLTPLLLVLALLLVACNDDFPCDHDQVLADNQCIADPREAGDGDAGDGDSGDGDSGDGDSGDGDSGDGDAPDAAEPMETGEFGRVCSEDGECAEPAPTCGKPPGASEGVCTVLGCQSAGVECPEGWSCLSFADACTEN